MAAAAQMSLGKSAWPARTSSYKVLKVGGVRRPRREVHPSVSQVYSDPKALVATEVFAARSDRTRATVESLHSQPLSDITAKDHLNIWGDVEAKEASHFELFNDNKPIDDFDYLSAAVGVDAEAEIVMADGHIFDSNDLFWTSDEPMMLAHDDANLFVEAGSGDMLMVDPRDIEGGRAAEAAVTDVAQELPSDLQLPEGFDLLEFVMDNSFGPDDPLFRQQIGDDALFTDDNLVSLTNDVVVNATHSNQEIATIDFGQLDLLAVAGSAPITEEKPLAPEVDLKMEAEEDEDEVAEDVQAPAKRPRGRPRVPRTSAAKRQPLPRRRQSSSSGSSYDPSSNDHKYRRMRDLNNLASKRCRQNRKQKMEILEKDLEKERERHVDLQMKVRLLEEQVKRIKDAIFKAIVPVSAPRVQLVASSSPVVDIDELIRQRAADFL